MTSGPAEFFSQRWHSRNYIAVEDVLETTIIVNGRPKKVFLEQLANSTKITYRCQFLSMGNMEMFELVRSSAGVYNIRGIEAGSKYQQFLGPLTNSINVFRRNRSLAL